MTVPLLVTPAWLAEHLGDPQVRPIDTRWYLTERNRGERDFLEAHIPGAGFLDIDRDLARAAYDGPGRHPIPDPQTFAEKAGLVGIGPDTHVIAYDASGGMAAARVWWLLRYFGHERVSLLDGGWLEWLAQGFPTESGQHPMTPAQFTPQVHPEMVVDADTIEQLRRDPSVLLLDARATERYEGRIEPMDKRAGHIPGAHSAPFVANLTGEGVFKSPDALRSQYQKLGADQAQTIACYCGSGVSAAHDVFALELAGYPGARLYEGSWSDWSSNSQRPVATGPDSVD